MNFNFLSDIELLQTSFWGNTYAEYMYAFGIFLLLLLVFGVLQYVLIKHLANLSKKTTTDIDDTIVDVVKSLKPPFYSFIAFFLAFQALETSSLIDRILYVVLLIWIVYQIIIAIQIASEYIFQKTIAKKDYDAGKRAAFSTLKNVLRAALWVFGAILILSNLGVDVTALVAGLGIGGIAVALAAQNILGDLFSSFAIIFDRPFVPGDFIVVGEHKGTVEKVGIKTTRIRALQGEEVVISNQELMSSRIHNFKKMEERRIVFTFGIVYEISSDVLEQVPKIVEDVITGHEKAKFDRVFFLNFGESALTFEAVYYVSTSDYLVYAKTHESILFKIKREFEKNKIDMAYPTQTLYVHKKK